MFSEEIKEETGDIMLHMIFYAKIAEEKGAFDIADALNAIKAALQSSSNTDQTVEIATEIDPDLIGGFVIEFGDRLYDASVKHKLDLLKKEFVGNLYTSQIMAR